MQSACAALYCRPWPARHCHILPHDLKNGTIFGKGVAIIKCVFRFSLQLLSEKFLILRRIKQDTIRNVAGLHVSICYSCHISMKPACPDSAQTSNFIKLRPLTAALFHGLTDRHDVAIRRFPKVCERAQNDTAYI